MGRRKKPELLMPAGSLEGLKTAVIFGADAVYIGGEAFGLRAKAKNFSPEEMAQGIAFAHGKGVKVYVTANILARNDDLEGAAAYFQELRDMEPERCDALIISDPGMFAIAREVWPEVEIHISTQANNTNYRTYQFWWKLGAKRVVSARELSLEEIHTIRERIPEEMEIESFVQGSMCISYSGRCLLSNYFTGRDANQGSCTHPCRWKYAVVEETRPGEYLPVYENERGTYIFNSKDLCMIEHIPELAEAGIDSLKIEGRMKTALYIATMARTYRKAIDDYFISEECYRENMDWYRAEIAKCTYRQFTTGFYFGKPSRETQIYDESTYVNEYIYLGNIEEVAAPWPQGTRKEENCVLARFGQRNKFSVGEAIEIMKPDGRNVPVTVEGMYNADGEPVESCPHARQTVWVKLSETPCPGDLLRVANVAKD
ncbi:peptidase U32 family protein [Acetatifactor aquisgranensis]|uniref:peptidase U32 family protein n=1 Tax=Acetatifactor aquisgranensis TaxID=2941233 RepID=UPI00203F37A1|nr:U32 family peptidase C-terminal domain-containing protein [Acetatifactor aquisgranensis]MCI8542041.1 U32 family peptidase [Lachnospiraceae bacterium]